MYACSLGISSPACAVYNLIPALKWQSRDLNVLRIPGLQVLYQLLILANKGTIWQPPSWELHWVDTAGHHDKGPPCPLGKVDDWLSSLHAYRLSTLLQSHAHISGKISVHVGGWCNIA